MTTRTIRGAIARHPLISFFALANALSWLAWMPYILSNSGLGLWDYDFPALLGTTQLVGVLPGAYLGPITSALLVTAIVDGRAGLRRWGARLWRWRVNWRWYALALLGMPLAIIVGGFVFSGGTVQAPPVEALVLFVPALMLQMVTTGLAEEPGWRDFALPRLQARFSPLAASFVLGPLWALWHMPLFLTEWGGFPNSTLLHVASFIGFCIAFNIVMSWVFNRTNQSLPISMLLHVGVNNTVSVLVPVMFPTMTTELNSLMLLVIASIMAAAIVIATRGRLGVPLAREVAQNPPVSTEAAPVRQ
ncbi:CPBP family intramembrane glutamic endopeptidase [Microbacterium sp.]|uniref:CPBP family intramembrane glutamic endopeptidase n=1 Tax=Microbacterium sp. TaxID=51671 RepID=UPI002623A6FC|nr:CPBP family intramembrane glutamic endopeptidase [Microbacterium sp.]